MCIKVKLIPWTALTDSEGCLCCHCHCHCQCCCCTGFAAARGMTDSFHMWNQLERWIDWLSTSETLDRFTPSTGLGSAAAAAICICWASNAATPTQPHTHSLSLFHCLHMEVFVCVVYSRNCSEIVSPTCLSMPEVCFFCPKPKANFDKCCQVKRGREREGEIDIDW